MKIQFYGTGTSHGVPILGCDCGTCVSTDPRNTRYRTCIHIQDEDASIIIDTPPEFRISALKYKLKRVDCILFTHAHSDHCAGLDDIRRFNEIQKESIPIFANKETITDLRKRFHYIFESTQEGGGKPKIELNEILEFEEISIKGSKIIPLKIIHGSLNILGFRINNFAFITDVSLIPGETFEYLRNLDILVIDALRIKPHPTHINLEQAIEYSNRIRAKKTYFTHISHGLEHVETESKLPGEIFLSYDGLTIDIP